MIKYVTMYMFELAAPTFDPDKANPAIVVNPKTDSNGEPHDPRIHSTPPKLNADGTWRAKRGVTAEQIAEVRAEREATQPVALAEMAEVASIAAAFEESVTAPVNEGVTANISLSAPPAPPVTTAPPAPIAVEHDDGSVTLPDSPIPPVYTTAPSFLDVMKAITAAQKDGKIDTAKVKELCAAVSAGESTMGLNGPDNGDKRVAFMALLASETEGK